MQRNYLTSNPIPSSLFGMAALTLAIGAFILTVTGSLREAFDLALSRQEATVPSITVRPLSTSLASQEAIIHKLGRVDGVQGVAATFRGAFKPEEERHSPTIRLPDTIQGTWSNLPGLEFPPPDPGTGLLTGRVPQSASIDEAVVGYELAQRLGKQVGDTLVVDEHPLVIVGIWQPSILSPGNVVQVPYDTIRQWLPRSRRSPGLSIAEGFDEMAVMLTSGHDAEEVARRIWHQVPEVEVLSPAQERAERQQTMLALDLVVLYSVLLTILVGGAVTVNAVLIAPREVTYHSRLSLLPMYQPALAALAGGLGGLLTGWLAVLGLNAYTVHTQARTLFIVTPRLVGEVVLLSALMGLAAGIWPALWSQPRQQTQDSPISNLQSPISTVLVVLGVALATLGVMLIGSLVESLYCSLGEGERVAADRISLEPTSSEVAYYEPLADALRRWPGILGIAVEAYGGAIVEDEERWIDRLPPSGVVCGLRPVLSSSALRPFDEAQDKQSSGQASLTVNAVEGSNREDFGLGVPYRVGLWQGRVFQPGSLDEAVIGYDLAARQGLRVGDTLAIRDHDFTVVGIRQRLVYGRMNDFNLRAEVSLEALRRVLGQPYAFGTITAFIPPAEREQDREIFLARLVERFSGTAVFTVKDRLAEIARDFPGIQSLVVESSDDTLLRARLLYFGLLAGVTIPLWGLAGLGIMSGLGLILAESRQEIQLRKLFGASDGDILARWLERAALWGGMGGLIGMGSGWLAIEAVNLYTNSYQRMLTLIVTPRLVVMTVVVAVLLGVIAGLGPAWRAARLSPVLSLVEGPLWEN
ncbi:MAG: FtsX-like permease family protein [Anaerolineae bacterium]|nr:FtsX-like permease family protein [Anaerolineae bacterium]